jgi:NADH:quinone reductase (non-electrogenic)
MTASTHVVIVGGGFGGVACAKKLAKAGVSVTLIDRNTYHQFQPLLYQVATAQLAPGDVMRPLRGLFQKDQSVAVKTAEVAAADPTTRTVTTAGGERFAGDYLVLAVGAKPNFFGVSGAVDYALPLYSATDAMRLRDRVLQLFEDADLEPSRIDRGALDFVVVGGGPTGVETAGALADLIRDVMPSRYHDLAVSRARIHLVDHGATLLAAFSDRAHEYAAKALTEKGVRLVLGASVVEVAPDRVKFADGSEILTHCAVWAGGLEARSLAGLEALPVARGGRISVGHDLAVDGFPGVYAVGDVASAPGPDGAAYPQLAAVAQQAGDAVAAAILADVGGKPAAAFRYHDKGIMAMIGRNAAVVEVGAHHHHELHGPVAFSAWLGVHAWLMSSSRARIDAFMSWAWDSFSTNRSPAIIEDPERARIDWGDDDDDDGEASTAQPNAKGNAS